MLVKWSLTLDPKLSPDGSSTTSPHHVYYSCTFLFSPCISLAYHHIMNPAIALCNVLEELQLCFKSLFWTELCSKKEITLQLNGWHGISVSTCSNK